MESPRLLTPAQAAKVLQLNISTVYELLHSGELPGRKIGGSWRIDERDLYVRPEEEQQLARAA